MPIWFLKNNLYQPFSILRGLETSNGNSTKRNIRGLETSNGNFTEINIRGLETSNGNFTERNLRNMTHITNH
jgi:hypothetical protein